ncbi:MAG TPA: ATP synthase F0 subunit B [Candidatus Binatia bacterium]|nr:ATP synthase F0 subunit B [Candidatus Binatia bacterium]
MSFVEVVGVAQAWASAAEAEHHAPSINQIWFPLANFLIFAFIIVHYALPPIRNFLRSRRDEVLATVREAAAKKQQAEAIVQDYKARLARVEQEMESIVASLRAEGEREKTKLLADTQALADNIKEDARFLADQEVKMARQKIREEIANQAEASARELIQRHLSRADQGRLVEDFIRSIGQVP